MSTSKLQTKLKAKSNPACVEKLWYAVEHNNVDTVQKLVAEGADINHPFRVLRTEQGHRRRKQTPIFIAVRKNYTSLVQFLLRANCDVNRTDDRGETVLFVAVHRGNLPLVKKLLAAGCDINHVNYKGEIILHTAVRAAKVDVLDYLLEHGCQEDVQDTSSRTPLRLALELHWKVADVTIRTRRGWQHAQSEIIELLARNSFGGRLEDSYYTNCIFCQAMFESLRSGSYAIPRLLVQHGIPVKPLAKLALETVIDYILPYDSIFTFLCPDMLRLIHQAGFHLQPVLQAPCRKHKPTINTWQDQLLHCSSMARTIRDLVFMIENPMSLSDICRVVIRQHIRGKLWQKVDMLPLPEPLKDFLKFKEFDFEMKVYKLD